MHILARLLAGAIALPLLGGCVNAPPAERAAARPCPVTEPVRATPPEDAAVQNTPEEGTYFVSADRSIWASAWWVAPEGRPLRVSEEGLKVGWFRPAGAALAISGRRLDAAVGISSAAAMAIRRELFRSARPFALAEQQQPALPVDGDNVDLHLAAPMTADRLRLKTDPLDYSLGVASFQEAPRRDELC